MCQQTSEKSCQGTCLANGGLPSCFIKATRRYLRDDLASLINEPGVIEIRYIEPSRQEHTLDS